MGESASNAASKECESDGICVGTEIILLAVRNKSLDLKHTLTARLINKTCNEAVLNSFHIRKFDAGQLVHQYFPEKAEDVLSSLNAIICFQKQLRQLTSLIPMQELEEVDLTVLPTVNITQLAYMFNDTPLPNLKRLNLSGVCIAKMTWDKLAELFPNISSIHVERHYVFFNDWPGNHNLQSLVDQGVDDESIHIIRSLQHYFSNLRSFYLH